MIALAWIKTNARLFGYGALIALGMWLGWQLRSIGTERALKQQETALIKQCNQDKAITERIDNEHLAKIKNLNSRVAHLKRVQPACVSVTHTASGDNGSAGRGVDAGSHVVTDFTLIDFAAIAEKYRLQLIACQDFLRSERK